MSSYAKHHNQSYYTGDRQGSKGEQDSENLKKKRPAPLFIYMFADKKKKEWQAYHDRCSELRKGT